MTSTGGANSTDSSRGNRQASPGDVDPTEDKKVLGSATGAVATAAAAFVAALCCVGPSTVALLGVGGSLAAASIKPYRPYLLLASLAMILYGFWRIYGRPRMRPGVACPTRIGRFSRSVLWIAAVVWVGAVILFRG